MPLQEEPLTIFKSGDTVTDVLLWSCDFCFDVYIITFSKKYYGFAYADDWVLRIASGGYCGFRFVRRLITVCRGISLLPL